MAVYRPGSITGFPEWLPAARRAELHLMDKIRAVFEAYGFCSIETPSVEELEVLGAKGEVDKEIYTIRRLHSTPEEAADEARLGLHFDQTVPLARYVAQHFNDLSFPFKRYQMQKVWRGERPQAGRFREFYQCDIDVINVDHLPLHFDAEMPLVIWHALSAMDIGRFQLRLNNRKILAGYLTGIGITDLTMSTRILDKIDKIGPDEVAKQLQETCGVDADTARRALALAEIRTPGTGFLDQVRALGVENETLVTGLEELEFVMNYLATLPEGAAVADLSIARGLDYYTGTVYETVLVDAPDYGSICSGGRYDDLASQFINRKLPGVGISIGFTRIFSKMVAEGRFDGGRTSPADLLVVLPREELRADVAALADGFRARGLKVEMYHAPQKLPKQIGYASKKGIPHVWFPPFEEGGAHEVKDMATGEQIPADPDSWSP